MGSREPKADPAEVIRAMREQALSVPAGDVGIVPGPGHARVWAVLMETGYAQGVASLVTIADGTTSLYFSNGGGIIGAGQHAQVRAAANMLIAAADANVDAFVPTEEHPLPAVGMVRFYARTFDGLLTAEAAQDDLAANTHRLFLLFRLGHAVITLLRKASPGQ